MSRRKERLTVTVDRELIEAANKAVTAGLADSLSAWVNQALSERVAKERRHSALKEAIEAFEAKFGVITPAEMAAQRRADRRNAIVVRGSRPRARRRGAA